MELFNGLVCNSINQTLYEMKIFLIILAISACVLFWYNQKLHSGTAIPSGTIIETNKSIYDFTVKDITGKSRNLSEFKGKVLVFVNVASKCGNTPQYKDIEAFYLQYKSKGVEVLGFPANNFMGQEPGTDAEIQSFCTKNYGVTFPLFSKISVKGNDMDPIYQYLTQKSQNGSLDQEVTWNFQKFIVNKEGKVVASFSPRTSVTSEEFLTAIKKLL